MPKLDILFEDDDLIIINKKANMLSIPDRYDPKLPNLKSLLAKKNEKIFVIHRLDKDTSGIIVFAKIKYVHQHLSKQWRENRVEKYYSAIVDGILESKSDTIRDKIGPSLRNKGKMNITQDGKMSITHYTVMKEFTNFSYLHLQIETGRMHQIRVHLSSIGHPIIVDPLYGKRSEFFLSEVKRKYKTSKYKIERPLLNRLALHAYKIKFLHPITKESLIIEAALPKDLKAVLNQFEKLSY